MPWGVTASKQSQNPPGFVGIEVGADHGNLLSLLKVQIQEVFQELGKIQLGASYSHDSMVPNLTGSREHEQNVPARAYTGKVLQTRQSSLRRQWGAHLVVLGSGNLVDREDELVGFHRGESGNL